MKKNDKLIALAGVIILVIASIGIYYWAPEETKAGVTGIESFFAVSGKMSDVPDAITVSDSCPFYPLIATPLAVHYDSGGEQYIAPLYVQDFDEPSSAVVRARSMIGTPLNEVVIDSGSAKEVSLEIAEKYWESSESALLIGYDQSGYELGVLATPLASYLSIPVIVTDEMDKDVENVLRDLGVTHTIVCGEELEGYGRVLQFNTVEEIMDAQIELVLEKFGKVDYITLTNPIDAWPPKVLDSFTEHYGPMTIPSSASTRLPQSLNFLTWNEMGTFTIPKDYKYALVKFEGYNLDCEDVDDFGDMVQFQVGANLPDIPAGLQQQEILGQDTGTGGVAVRDANGKLVKDRVYVEAVLYDRGGVEYTVRTKGQWMLKKSGEATATVTVEKLEHPVYPMMKKLSSLAPYLTAYHQGIIFGKPEFAFTADDDVISLETGEASPGFYMPCRNPRIVDNSNRHIYDNIVQPLNEILAKLAGIELSDDTDLKNLRDYYDDEPVYIALAGGATVLPNYIYQNYLVPVDYWDAPYGFGPGTPSDVIYGNIDPKPYDWSNTADDIFTKYPYQENIVGRITGWDTQDASALIARNVFYNDIIDNLDKWKDSIAVLMGEGVDFRAPPLRLPIAKLTGAAFHDLLKMWTGFGEILLENAVENIAKPLGFENIYQAYKEPASLQGFSDEHLKRLKWETGLLSKLNPFYVSQLRQLVGDGNVIGKEAIENSNFVFLNGHGNKNILVMNGIDLVTAGYGGPIIHWLAKKIFEVMMPYAGPGLSLSSHIQYNTRELARYEFNPSVCWLDSCMVGKIDGIYPENAIGQAFLHAGFAALIASPTETNIAGGYLEPKYRIADTPFSVLNAYIQTKNNARKGIWPDIHFGFLIYNDMVFHLKDHDSTIGMAFREAKNHYLEQDADWELWWSPPLVTTGNFLEDTELRNSYYEKMENKNTGQKLILMENKYMAFQEYVLFGDPALNPYLPGE